MGVEIQGIEELTMKFDKMTSANTTLQSVKQAVAVVEGSAREKAPKSAHSSDIHLQGSIESTAEIRGNDIVGTVFTPLYYGPFVELGTGIHAEKGGTSGYWVYVDDETSQGAGTGATKRYTKEEAKRVVARMRRKGIKAFYTNGQKPQPFMRPALAENRENVKRILQRGLIK